MDLLIPKTYRLKAAQEAWLQACAEEEGHGSTAVVLRRCIDQEMLRQGMQVERKRKPANGKNRAA